MMPTFATESNAKNVGSPACLRFDPMPRIDFDR
jgi:hypothetical protein